MFKDTYKFQGFPRIFTSFLGF